MDSDYAMCCCLSDIEEHLPETGNVSFFGQVLGLERVESISGVTAKE